MFRRYTPLIALFFLLAGCAGGAALSIEQQLAVTCRAYSGTLNVLSLYRPDMNPGQVASVDAVVAIAHPTCAAAAGGGMENPQNALTQLRGGLRTLLILEQEIEQ